MARLQNLTEGHLQRISLHEPVDAAYYLYEIDGRRLLQINTVGRKSREMPDKVSQTFQFDEQSAAQLFEILRAHFGLK